MHKDMPCMPFKVGVCRANNVIIGMLSQPTDAAKVLHMSKQSSHSQGTVACTTAGQAAHGTL